ncbi:DUF305 domain-containing protein [Nocardia farcinica]
MTVPRAMRIAASAALALTLLVLGAALRPLVLPERHSAPPVLGTVETGFAQDMAAHHQQALLMADRLAPDADPTVRRLARQITDTQRIEIGTMLGWLRLAGASPLATEHLGWLPAGHRHDGPDEAAGGMPGMASTADLDALAAARGRDADILFLQLMIRHHEGGVAMARAANALLERGPVKETARSMVQQQGQELGVLNALLVQFGGQPLP